MPQAAGGGSSSKPPKKNVGAAITASRRKTVQAAGTGGVSKGGAGSSQTAGYSPADRDKPTGLSPADKRAKKAAQAKKSEAKHAARRLIESKRDTMKRGGRTKVSEPGPGSSASDITNSRRAFARAGGRSKYGGTPGAMKAARGAIAEKGSAQGSVSQPKPKASSKPRPGLAPRPGAQAPKPRTGGSGFGGTKPPTSFDPGSRPGPVSYTPENPPPFFEGGGQGGGAGEGGANPLSPGITQEELKRTDLDSILHGAKRRGRIALTRGTE